MSPRKPRPWPDTPAPLAAPVDNHAVGHHAPLPTHAGEIPGVSGVALSLDEQLDRARKVGVTALVSSACELPDFDPMIDIARARQGVRVALAIHPNEAALHAGCAEPSPDGLTPRVRAPRALDRRSPRSRRAWATRRSSRWGERTGLLPHRRAGRQAQKESFRAHIEMADHGPASNYDRDLPLHGDTRNL